MNELYKINKNWPEDYVELHAGRLLILIMIAGKGTKKRKIKSRTKLAKLDFFLRYPYYLKKASEILQKDIIHSIDSPLELPIDPSMIRYVYGPWDQRYYNVFNYLIARNLINIRKDAQSVDNFYLTIVGKSLAESLMQTTAYEYMTNVAKIVNSLFKNWSGNKLKMFIYESFPEIVSLPLKKMIKEVKINE